MIGSSQLSLVIDLAKINLRDQKWTLHHLSICYNSNRANFNFFNHVLEFKIFEIELQS